MNIAGSSIASTFPMEQETLPDVRSSGWITTGVAERAEHACVRVSVGFVIRQTYERRGHFDKLTPTTGRLWVVKSLMVRWFAGISRPLFAARPLIEAEPKKLHQA